MADRVTPHGIVQRYTETETKTNRGTVYYRAVPDDPARPITYHRRLRDAVAALAPAGVPEGGEPR